MKNSMLPEYMCDEILMNHQATERILRNTNDFRLPKYKKACTQNTVWHNGLKLFNMLPDQPKSAPKIDDFKDLINPWLRINYPA
jgi:hypothetical protein